jgi:cyanobactin maturation PatA/PatG family protease
MLSLSIMIAAADIAAVATLPGLKELWAETRGDSRICIAVLDGPVDQSHPSLAGASLQRLETLASGLADQSPASQHGSHIASVIFAQHDGPVAGLAPHCRGLVVPVFTDEPGGGVTPCSQIDLARAILQAAQQGAHVINISGGQDAPSGRSHPLLADAVRYCASKDVLIVAAVGNQGCACLQVPAALPFVLAVGAMTAQGLPLSFSNWGETYQTEGVIAPGENILGARPGGGIVASSGTSYATAVVSGIAALLLSLQIKSGQKPSPRAVRAAILRSALDCEHQPVPDCRRLLAGRLNVHGAMSLILGGVSTVSDPITTPEPAQMPVPERIDPKTPAILMTGNGVQAAGRDNNGAVGLAGSIAPTAPRFEPTCENKQPGAQPAAGPAGIVPSACSCARNSPRQLVYALGQLSFDFGSEARRDSMLQHMDEPAKGVTPDPNDRKQLLGYLDKNPWDAAAVNWTLNLDATPIYAIQPQGPFAVDACQRLRDFLREELDEGVERVSIPGVLAGKVRLFNGQVVPVIEPELRGMYSWTIKALVQAVVGRSLPDSAGTEQKSAQARKTQAVAGFLERVYFEIRNLGVTPQERAINFAATNAFSIEKVYESALADEMDLDTIEVEPSPICRHDSDCWDVKLLFFFPQRQVQTVRKAYRFSIDVSDVVPVTVGAVRSWFVR